MRRANTDVLAGLAFVGFGIAFSAGAASYEIGTALRMGPGYFPLLVGGLLVVLGVVIVVKGIVAGDGLEVGPVPWRAVILISGAILLFGATIRGLGVVPSVFLTALLAGLAGRRSGIVGPVVIAAGLTVACVLIFVVALQLRLPMLGSWFP
jgi:Tripartite tricarboxylate transporter TctB family